MTGQAWFKCYPSDFLNGVSDLSPQELAVYTIVLMRMYDEEGPIPDEPERIARRCNMRLPACKKAIDGLVNGGKLIRHDGHLYNERARNEIEKRHEQSTKQASNAQKRWQQRPKKYSKINDRPERPHCHADAEVMPTRDQIPDTREEKEAKASQKKGSRLPPDWTLPDDWRQWALDQGHPDPAGEAERFRDYWIGLSGQRAVKADWQATWRNWIRKSLENSSAREPPARPQTKRTPAEQARRQRYEAALRRYKDSGYKPELDPGPLESFETAELPLTGTGP